MKVLIADDEKELTNALSAILKHNNYSVDCVYNGEDALYYIENGTYDALILDVMMPKVDGYKVLETLRKAGNTTPIMMLTAKSDIDDKVKGLDLGADDYLPKPFEVKELLARLRVILRRNSSTTTNVLTLGNLSLDISTYEIFVGDSRVKLSNKEFQIIELLMLKPGNVISTERIMDKAWDYDTEAELNVVWVFISGLRKTLAQINANVEIRSNRGVGYTIEIKNA